LFSGRLLLPLLTFYGFSVFFVKVVVAKLIGQADSLLDVLRVVALGHPTNSPQQKKGKEGTE
jgi:hypothetical protein